MKTAFGLRILMALMSLAVVAPASSAERPPTAPDVSIDLPAGLACTGFDMRIEIWGAGREPREFRDRNGNVVRILEAGKGNTLAFTNLDTLTSYVVGGTGSVQHTVVNPDGTSTVSNTGHNVIIFFPSDVPAGPSTKQYIGKIVYTVDQNGTFTLQSAKGREIDICAAID